jgi:hypothetical protein
VGGSIYWIKNTSPSTLGLLRLGIYTASAAAAGSGMDMGGWLTG